MDSPSSFTNASPSLIKLKSPEQLETASARLAAGQPQRQVAADLGLARSTLQEWCKPVAVGAAPAALAAWVETAKGVRWLLHIEHKLEQSPADLQDHAGLNPASARQPDRHSRAQRPSAHLAASLRASRMAHAFSGSR